MCAHPRDDTPKPELMLRNRSYLRGGFLSRVDQLDEDILDLVERPLEVRLDLRDRPLERGPAAPPPRVAGFGDPDMVRPAVTGMSDPVDVPRLDHAPQAVRDRRQRRTGSFGHFAGRQRPPD